MGLFGRASAAIGLLLAGAGAHYPEMMEYAPHGPSRVDLHYAREVSGNSAFDPRAAAAHRVPAHKRRRLQRRGGW